MKDLATLSVCAVCALLAMPIVQADTVEIRIRGEVDFNQINTGPLDPAIAGDDAEMRFTVDVDNFVDSMMFPTRGYIINENSFSFTAGLGTVGMQNPLPMGTTPMFVIRNDDPAVDGFFTGLSPDGFEQGVPSDSTGILGQFAPKFSVAYTNDPLPSLDILDAVGTYDFTGISSFSYTVDDGFVEAMFVNFVDLRIRLQGDLNGDACVDQMDLGILLSAFNVGADGDLDDDGMTGQSDLGILLANFGCGNCGDRK